MSDIAIKVENLSKLYQLGSVGSGNLGTDITRWWAQLRGKEDPYAKVAIANDRSQRATSEFVWSLKDIDFEVKRGDALGIIGKNGAGKSTLLKILSRTTSPTTGSVKIKGRVASLLEVGTGFHGDLSGRENIYMNGSILGMRRAEITSKMEEIIEFSGVAGYIDTPVKRYSSGMYVRLAFAVAAHLDPEILIVDEVLAVGDTEFQKKCLGKMQEVNNKEGRTVIFVSHNIIAINTLCKHAIYLKHGNIFGKGDAADITKLYLQNESVILTHKEYEEDAVGDEVSYIKSGRILNQNNALESIFDWQDEITIEMIYCVKRAGFKPTPNFHLYNANRDCIFVSFRKIESQEVEVGVYKAVMRIPSGLLNIGRYSIGLAATTFVPQKVHFYDQDVLVFDVIENMELRDHEYKADLPGIIRMQLPWNIEKIK